MATAPAGTWAPTAPPPRRHGAGHIVLIVIGSLILLVSLGLLGGGSFLLHADRTQRDADGYIHTSTEPVTSPTYAIASRTIDITTGTADWVLTSDRLGSVRITATGADGRAVFVGIGPQTDVDAYLSGVEYDSVSGVRADPFRLTYDRRSGTSVPAAPGTRTFWVASAGGSGTQTLTWSVQSGRWAAVLMNADGSRGVDADLRVAATVPFLFGVSVGLIVAGGVLLAIAVLMIALGARGSRPLTPPPGWAMVPAGWTPAAPGAAPPGWTPQGVPPPPPAPPVGAGAPTGRPTVYPVALEARLDEPLSRWLWLVKWLLAIPHFIVLVFLWVAFWVLTVVAFFAILFTGRYPRSIFDVNVGIMRWTWRVAYYTFGGLGTDRYPPFSFEPRDYPATLEVAYPEQLSRGLVLVKWWLLAIPHYLVVGVLAGGGFAFAERAQGWAWTPAGGLIGAVSLAAGIMLLVKGRYPRGLHDLVVGLVRWVARVGAYAALMRDEYPPFRLDLGPSEPGPEATRPTDVPVGMLPRPG